MGLDGGTIPTRGELVQMKKKPEQKDKLSDMIHKWNNCTITQLPLVQPIVTCHLGMLYNKQSVIELLLGKVNMKECAMFNHIESLRDMRELKLTSNPLPSENSNSSYVCPITGLEMNGRPRFVCLWSCGCVLSERALIQVKTNACHNCGICFDKDDVVILNPNEDDFIVMKDRMIKRKLQKKHQVDSSATLTSHVDHQNLPSTESSEPSQPSTSALTHNEEQTTPKNTRETETKRKENKTDHHKHKRHKSGEKRDKNHKSQDEMTPIDLGWYETKQKHKNHHYKHKKHKSDEKKKHKKHKKVKTSDDKPKLHPGWNKYLSKLK